MSATATPPVNGSKPPPAFEEEAKAGTPADAEAKEKARLDEEIRKRSEASGSGPDPNRTGSAGKGPGGPSQAGSGSEKGPVFDRDAAERRIKEVPNRAMTKKVGDRDERIFDQAELDLLDLDVAALKKKPDERKAALKRWKVPDLVKLQGAKTDLQERARGWRRRALELEEEAWAANQKAAKGKSNDEKKKEFLAKLTGKEPWLAWNGIMISARSSKKVGDWSQELMFGEMEVDVALAPLTKMAAEEQADSLVNLVVEIGPTTALALALGALMIPKAFMAWTRWRAERAAAEEAAKRKPPAPPGLGKEPLRGPGSAPADAPAPAPAIAPTEASAAKK